MKAEFFAWYTPTEAEFTAAWETSLFVFDANMVLNFFRYSEKARDDLFAILNSEKARDRIWIPHQAALEYHRNLYEVRRDQKKKHADVVRALETAHGSTRAHDFRIKIESLLDQARKASEAAEERYKSADEAALVERIATLFLGKVGAPWAPEKLAAAYKDGEARYERKTPPGFADRGKKGSDRFGDYVVWLQTLEHAAKVKQPIFFITDDDKEDWWRVEGGERLGPRSELREEMKSKADVFLWIYNGAQFIERASKAVGLHVPQESLVNAEEVQADQSREMAAHAAVLGFVIRWGSTSISAAGPWGGPNPWPLDVADLGDGMTYHRSERTLLNGDKAFLYVAMAENGSKRAARRLRTARAWLPWSADQDEGPTI